LQEQWKGAALALQARGATKYLDSPVNCRKATLEAEGMTPARVAVRGELRRTLQSGSHPLMAARLCFEAVIEALKRPGQKEMCRDLSTKREKSPNS
jgi:hypothetical protein